MTVNTCRVCGSATPDGWVCVTETERARQQLAEIAELTEAARAVMYRQTSTGDSGHARPGPRDLLDYGAGARLDAVQTALTGWVRAVREDAKVKSAPREGDLIAACADWLADHVEVIRHLEIADEILREIGDCWHTMRSVVERGREPDKVVGACNCQRILYAKAGRAAVKCPECDAVWDVTEARDELRGRLNGKLVTAAEAAHLGAYLDTDRTSQQVRKLVNKWAERDQLEPRDGREVLIKHRHRPTCQSDCKQVVDRLAVYRFGDIADRLANTPRRAA